MSDELDITYHYYEAENDAHHPPAGVTAGHLVVWSGEPGPARIAAVAMITDDHGGVIVQTGDLEDCTVVDDREPPPTP